MNPLADYAQEAVLAHPGAALRLSDLLGAVAVRADYSLTLRRLRTVLADHPERFRIVDSWDARWPEVCDPERTEGRAWIVSIDDGERLLSTRAGRLRESVRWLSRSIDTRSAADLGRWEEIAVEEADLRQALGGAWP